MARELLSTPQEQQQDEAALEEQDLAYSTEESPPVVPPQDGDNAIANLEQARSTEVDDADIQDLQNPEGGYAAVMETEATPLIKSPEDSPEADAEAYDNAKGLGLSFVQGLWNGTEEIGYTVAEMADSAFDMESPTYFKDWAKSVELQPTEWKDAGEAAMVASTANALAGGAGQFLSGFMPALKALQIFKASGKVMPWMKKVIGTGVAGATADFAVWDPTEKRAVDFLASYGDEMLNEAAAQGITEENMPAIKAQLARVLTSDFIKKLQYQEGDSQLMGRTKQALEGFVLGKVLDPIMGALGSLARLKKPVNQPYKRSKHSLDETTQEAMEEAPIEIGSTVRASDQNNFGKVVSINGTKAKVRFENKANGTKAVVELDVEQLSNTAKKPLGRELTQKEMADMNFDKDFTLDKKVQEKFNKAFIQNADPKAASEVLLKSFTPMLDSVLTVKDMETMLARAQAIVGEATDQAGTWKDSLDKATQDKLFSQEGIARAGAKTTDLSADAVTLALIKRSLGERVRKAGLSAKDFKNGGKGLTEQQYKKILANAYAMNQFAKIQIGEIGRALNIVKLSKKGVNGEQVMDIDDIFNHIEKKGWSNISEHIDMMAKSTDDMASESLEHIGERNWMRAWTEGFINSVLSPTSLGINMTSNAIMMVARTADIHMAAFRGGGGITHKQAFAHTLGYLQAIPEAFRVMYKSYKNDKAAFSNNKRWVNEFQPKAAITSGNLGFKGDDLNFMKKSMNGTIDTIGKIFRGVPGGVRSMMATDEFFKVMNHRAYSMKVAVESIEQTGANSLKNPKQFAKGVIDEFEKIQNSSKSAAKEAGWGSPEYMALKKHSEAMEEAHLATFTNEWGPNSEQVYKTLRSQPWTSLILPFVRQPVNNMLYLAKSTPGLSLMSRRMSKELAAGGARAQLAQAHLNVASMVWAYAFMTAFAEGGKIQGNPKGDQGSRTESADLGIDPNTFQNEDGDFVNYRGGEPVAGRWAIAAGLMHQWMKIMNEAGPNMTDEEVEQASWDMVIAGGLTVMDNFKDQSSLRGLENTLKIFEGGTEGSFKKRTEMMLTGWIPNLSGQIKYLREQYMDEDQVRYSAEGISQEYDKRLGGGEIVQLNSFGDAMPGAHPQMLGQVLGISDSHANPVNFIPTNIRKTKGFEEDWQKEIVRVKQALPGETVLGQVPKRIDNVKIDNRERHNLLKFLKYIKPQGKTLAQAMRKEMKSRSYKRGTDEFKAAVIKQVYKAYMEAAKVALVSDAASYYKNKDRHKRQRHWKKMGLVDYGRSRALSVLSDRQTAKDTNRLLQPGDRRRIDVDSFEEKASSQRAGNLQQIQNILN